MVEISYIQRRFHEGDSVLCFHRPEVVTLFNGCLAPLGRNSGGTLSAVAILTLDIHTATVLSETGLKSM